MSKKSVLAAMLAVFLTGTTAFAVTAYPNKTVEVVYHSSIGSGGDIMLRAMDQALVNVAQEGKVKHIGWVINNMPGGSGARAWTYVSRAKPDGYTLLGVSSTILTSPLMNDMDLNYKSFTPIAMVFIDPMVVAVPGNSPYNSFPELIDAAKKNPSAQNWAGGVAGELGVVAGLEVQKYFECKVNLVPFEGGGDAAASLMGGHLDAAIGEFAELAEAARSGKVKIVACFNDLNVEGFEKVPTMAELGHPEINITKLRGILGPKDMDQEVVDVLVAQIRSMLDAQSFKDYVSANGLIVDIRTGDDFTKTMEEQTALLKASLENSLK
ncbi:MAG: tripartite tricarboxylate transporter substrate binding protein [Pyramidobacter sp.]|uniref:Bug family tripartite tricarboxylate transporter substrate binding protein n=1 Tax=Pyramidobacter sp. TaxID=1943581 RepID=UPI002A7F535B|nr:tripartite tricarboxylate transporter substrate binding protein [Pyramidobacter sp.]MDY4033206.1 tripartite tricarboxylate transporter substrate binding protein [Pyramidobacter sp.]